MPAECWRRIRVERFEVCGNASNKVFRSKALESERGVDRSHHAGNLSGEREPCAW
jgi:hypothetical protein